MADRVNPAVPAGAPSCWLLVQVTVLEITSRDLMIGNGAGNQQDSNILANFVGQSRTDRELYSEDPPELAEDLREEVGPTIAEIFPGIVP